MRGKRYPGTLRESLSDRQPTRLGALAVASSSAPTDPGAARRELRLDKWQMELWTRRNGLTSHPEHVGGRDPTEWLDAIGRMLDKSGRLTLFCPNVVQALSLLRVWELIDARVLALEPSPLLICDPPTALLLRLTDRPGRLLLLDVRNYGVSISHDSNALDRTCAFARGMLQALDSARLGALQATVGAQSLYGFRRSYMSDPPQTHVRPMATALERSALHGGRAECYRLGRVEGPVYALDWTSFYGSIMSDTALPVRLRHYGREWAPHGLRQLEEGRGVIARVKVRTEYPHLPCLRNGLVVYPVGEWVTTLAGPDLTQAVAAREVVEGYEWASYDLVPALREYAYACLRLRASIDRDTDPELSVWSKALANCLVGKLGQERCQWDDRPRAEPVHQWGTWSYVDRAGKRWHYRSLGGKVQRETKGGETATSVPAVPAWIYAEGRRRLWQMQLIAGRDEVLYCHTDSLFLTQTGYDRLQNDYLSSNREPGRLRLAAVWDWIEILGISHYRVPGRVVCSGVVGSGGAETGDSHARWRGETAQAAVAEGHPPRPVEIRATGETVRPYLHGVRGSDGRVSPWRV